MSYFSTELNSDKPANKRKFITHKQVASRFGVSERTVRRSLRDQRVRKILGAVRCGGWLRVPDTGQPTWYIREQLARIGKWREVPPSTRYAREMGMRNRQRERETRILRLALDLDRKKRKRRLTKKTRYEIEELPKVARIVAANYRCSVFDVPKFYERFLTARNNREKQRNAAAIKWLKRHGLWTSANPNYCEWLKRQGFYASAKALINSGEDYTQYQDGNDETRKMFFGKGSGHFEAVIGYQGADGRSHNFLLPNRFIEEGKSLIGTVVERHIIHLSAVKTKAQLSRQVRLFKELWPSKSLLRKTTRNLEQAWRVMELRGALRILRRKGTAECGEKLRGITYRNPRAKELGKIGMCLRHFRHLYPGEIFARARVGLGDLLPVRIRTGSQVRKDDAEGVQFASQRANDEKDYERRNDQLRDTSESAKIAKRDLQLTQQNNASLAEPMFEFLVNELSRGGLSKKWAKEHAADYGLDLDKIDAEVSRRKSATKAS